MICVCLSIILRPRDDADHLAPLVTHTCTRFVFCLLLISWNRLPESPGVLHLPLFEQSEESFPEESQTPEVSEQRMTPKHDMSH